jgi:hypothetical protein
MNGQIGIYGPASPTELSDVFVTVTKSRQRLRESEKRAVQDDDEGFHEPRFTGDPPVPAGNAKNGSGGGFRAQNRRRCGYRFIREELSLDCGT